MPKTVKEIIETKEVDEFYRKPIEEKIVIFLTQNNDEAFTNLELISKLEKGINLKAGDDIDRLIIFVTVIAYIKKLDYLKAQGIIDDYNDGSNTYYFLRR